jgi:hypothetical protein
MNTIPVVRPTMNTPDYEIEIFHWIGRTPWLLVACAGVVLCMVFAGKYPRRCLLIGSALAIEFATYAAAPFITPWLLNSNDIMELRWRILINTLIYSIPSALALGLLLWAAFAPMWPSRSNNS